MPLNASNHISTIVRLMRGLELKYGVTVELATEYDIMQHGLVLQVRAPADFNMKLIERELDAYNRNWYNEVKTNAEEL